MYVGVVGEEVYIYIYIVVVGVVGEEVYIYERACVCVCVRACVRACTNVRS